MAAPSARDNPALWERHWQRLGRPGNVASHTPQSRHFQESWALFQRHLPAEAKRVLDAGCGPGEYSFQLARCLDGPLILGVDRSEASARRCEEGRRRVGYPRLRFAAADLAHLGLRTASCDLILCLVVICYLDPPAIARALDELRRVLSPGGRLLVTVPNLLNITHTAYRWWMGGRYEYGYEVSWTPHGLARLLRRHGFERIRLDGYYPAHFTLRLGGHSQVLAWAGRALLAATPSLDRLARGGFSRSCGSLVLATATRPPAGRA